MLESSFSPRYIPVTLAITSRGCASALCIRGTSFKRLGGIFACQGLPSARIARNMREEYVHGTGLVLKYEGKAPFSACGFVKALFQDHGTLTRVVTSQAVAMGCSGYMALDSP